MPLASRRGDLSHVPEDMHACSECPHDATGPATSGSPNVKVNSRLALRVGDTGEHDACCGDNTWVAKTGASRVMINGKLAMRVGDTVEHCGGEGKMIEGSPNVLIGDRKGRKPRKDASDDGGGAVEELALILVDPFDNEAEVTYVAGEVYVDGAIHEEEHVFTEKSVTVKKGQKAHALFYHSPLDEEDCC